VEKSFEFNLELGVEIIGLPQWAEVEAFKCDHNEDNAVQVDELAGSTDILGSFTGFTGILQLNQSTGLLNNQGNILAAGLTGVSGDTTTFGLSMVEAAVEKANIDNALEVEEIIGTTSISPSFNNFTGLAQINQSTGVLNNQNNVMVLGANLDTTGLVAENDTFLTMQNANNDADVPEITASASITDSFQNSTGAVQINQTPTALNNQTNIISVAFSGRNP